MKKLYPSLLGLLGGLVMAACEPAEPDVATLRINLIDAPGDYESVNIDIADVQVKMEGDAGEWLSLDEVNTGVFNVLELTNGHSALLGEVDLPPGTLQQVRLVLGQNHDLSIGGEVKALPFASGSTGVIELDVVGDLSANRVFELVLDFDAGRSVVASESGETFRLRPVVRVILDPDNGSIMGRIDPGAVSTAVFALIGADTITSTYTGGSGGFVLSALPSGDYTLSIEPLSGEGYNPTLVTGITVNEGIDNDLGTVFLPRQ